MTENPDSIAHPVTHLLSRLTRAEQLQVIQTHPLFTGECPECGAKVSAAELPPIDWDCLRCGWIDCLVS
jgi:hypothetical protein